MRTLAFRDIALEDLLRIFGYEDPEAAKAREERRALAVAEGRLRVRRTDPVHEKIAQEWLAPHTNVFFDAILRERFQGSGNVLTDAAKSLARGEVPLGLAELGIESPEDLLIPREGEEPEPPTARHFLHETRLARCIPVIREMVAKEAEKRREAERKAAAERAEVERAYRALEAQGRRATAEQTPIATAKKSSEASEASKASMETPKSSTEEPSSSKGAGKEPRGDDRHEHVSARDQTQPLRWDEYECRAAVVALAVAMAADLRYEGAYPQFERASMVIPASGGVPRATVTLFAQTVGCEPGTWLRIARRALVALERTVDEQKLEIWFAEKTRKGATGGGRNPAFAVCAVKRLFRGITVGVTPEGGRFRAETDPHLAFPGGRPRKAQRDEFEFD